MEEGCEQMEAVGRERRGLAQEARDVANQLAEGGRSSQELGGDLRRLELEKAELAGAVDEAQAALEAEESKATPSTPTIPTSQWKEGRLG